MSDAIIAAVKRGNFEAKDGDWEARNDALSECTRLFVEAGERLAAGPVVGQDFFDATTWRALRLPLQSALKDLRSHLVREACGLIGAATSTCNNADGHPRPGAARDGGRMLLRDVVPTLFELVSSGNKTNAKFVDDCIKEVLVHCRYKQFVHTVAEYSAINNKGKSAHVREACARYARELAATWGAAYFRRHDDALELLEKCVTTLLRDPSAEARAAAREAFHALATEFPERVEGLLTDLDNRIKARLAAPGKPIDSGVTSARKRLARPQTATKPPPAPPLAPELHLGQRVRAQKCKTATVRFLGETNFSTGQWVGVELDAPDGKHDGCVNDHRYFEAPPHHGLFVRPAHCAPLSLEDDTPDVVAASKLACEHKRFLGDLLELLQRQLSDLAKFENVDISRANAPAFALAVADAPNLFRTILDAHVARLAAEASIRPPPPPEANPGSSTS